MRQKVEEIKRIARRCLLYFKVSPPLEHHQVQSVKIFNKFNAMSVSNTLEKIRHCLFSTCDVD